MTFEDHLAHWFCGDAEAVDFAVQAWDAAQLWDDLVDEGKCRDMQALLAWLAFDKEDQPFFRDHGHILRPVMRSVYLQWTAANVLERGDRQDVQKAWMLRAGIYGLFHVMAGLCGGDAWAREIGPDIWRQYGETADALAEEFSCPVR